MDWAANVDAAALGALVSAASAVLVPRIIERVPSRSPTGARRRRTPRSTSSSLTTHRRERPSRRAPDEPAETMPVRAAEQAPAAQPRSERGSRTGQGAADEPELYFAIADTPGLLWRCVLAGAVAGGLIGLAVGWDWALLCLLPLVPVSLALAVIDWRTRLLPTWLIARTYVGLIVLLVVCALITQDWHDLVRAAIGWAGCGAAVLRALVHPPARARLRRRPALRDPRPRPRLRRHGRAGGRRLRRVPPRRRGWRSALDAADRAPQGLPLRSVHVRRRDRRAAGRRLAVPVSSTADGDRAATAA